MNYASFWKRFGAVMIDGLIIWVPSLVLSLVMPIVGSIVLSLLYFPIFNSSKLMATPGKAFMGIKVVTEAGNRLTFKESCIRYAVSFISGLFLCAGYIMYFFTEKSQTFHDALAGTVVVLREPNDPTLWWESWLAEFKRLVNKADEPDLKA